jgi:hypothetical protein
MNTPEPPTPPQEPPGQSATAEPGTAGSLAEINIWVGRAIGISFFVLLAGLLFSFWAIFEVLRERGSDAQGNRILLSTAEKMSIAASTQVAVGMMMGFVSVFMGLMMSWFGINAQFEMSGKAGDKSELSLTSASPGLLFFLGGIILIGFSLNKEIQFRDFGDIRKQAVQDVATPQNNGKRPTPKPPPPTTNIDPTLSKP